MKKHIWVLEHIFDVGGTLQWLQSVVASAVCNSVWLARLGMSYWAEQYVDTGMNESRCFVPSDQHCHAMIVGATSGTLYLVPSLLHVCCVKAVSSSTAWPANTPYALFCFLHLLSLWFCLFYVFYHSNLNPSILHSPSQTFFRRLV